MGLAGFCRNCLGDWLGEAAGLSNNRFLQRSGAGRRIPPAGPASPAPHRRAECRFD
ncbi:DUF1244 domain-containing protein, partial [Klebsiella pneumoniae]|uniref:DUF1244 domain-containing protein n=1 Tax=Klebsiella pneumoniae TaxID=573 RepID=UPI0027BA9C31